MYRLLIVDDEIDVAEGIHTYLQGIEELDLAMQTAYSAPEALEVMGRTKIDIVLSDIVMPGSGSCSARSMISMQACGSRLQWNS